MAASAVGKDVGTARSVEGLGGDIYRTQKAKREGEYKTKQQRCNAIVRIANTYITYSYARAKLVFQGKACGVGGTFNVLVAKSEKPENMKYQKQ